jgi:hypothetical protein
MTRRHGALYFSISVAVVSTLAPCPARADVTKIQCIDANTKGQDLRRDGKLSAAREQLRACAVPACPAMVRDDCTERPDELERAQPTMAFEVKSSTGVDLVRVRVSVDGQPIVDRVEGKPMNVDPGAHLFTFESDGLPPVTQRFVLTEGEKGRQERITMAAATAPAPQAAPPPPAPEANGPPGSDTGSLTTPPISAGGGMSTRKVLGLVAGAAGVAGVAVGSVFGLMTASASSAQM